jgi:signal transduction histidine kinase
MLMLRRAETLRRQQLEFVAGVTHELNTPLAALQSAGQNLADGVTHEPAQVARYGVMITREARRLGDMVGQVLEYAGMQSGRVRKPSAEIDVAEVLDDAVAHTRWLCDQENVNVEVQIASDLPPVIGDAPSLSRAVQNLIGNAVKYGGAKKWIGVRAEQNGGGVVIGVDDAGPGIAPDEARRLFEPFYRGKGSDRARGSGLGLTIVKQIIDQHGGRIEIERSSRGGASFNITLPEARRG